MVDYNAIIDKYYPADSPLRDIYLRHCSQVAELALEIASRKNLPLTDQEISQAAMLHDIGIFLTDAKGIHCQGTEPYIRHGILGAELLRLENADEKYARVAERHTGSGLTASEIEGQHLPLPHRDFVPETMLERLICYADKFFSKSGDMQRKPLDKVIKSMERFGDESLRRFLELHREFGI